MRKLHLVAKSDHKKAWQTAQRALQTAKNAETLARAAAPRDATGLRGFYARHQWIINLVIATVAPTIAVASAYLDTTAEIAARDADDHSYVLPFIIQNKSKFFEMTNVAASCGLTAVALTDQFGQEMYVVGSRGSSETIDPIKAGKQINFPCDFSHVISYNSPRGEPARFSVAHLTTVVTVNYTILGHWRRSVKSDEFTWDRGAKGYHWLRGNMLH